MKLSTLIAPFLLLGSTMAAQAQSTPLDAGAEAKPVPAESKAGAVAKPAPNTDDGISLASGLLEDVVLAIERRIPSWPQRGSWKMPNVVFGSGTENARVPAPTTLREVTPLQALTLVAAAAGCVLEPIKAITEEARSQYAKGQIIGYRLALGGTSGSINAETANSPQPAIGLIFPPRKGALRGAGKSGLTGIEIESTRPEKSPFSLPAKRSTLTVRVYSLGSVIFGTDSEKASKEKRCEDLIGAAILAVENDAKALPEISFHSESRTLVVKATAAQHLIIGEVIGLLAANKRPRSAPVDPPPATSNGSPPSAAGNKTPCPASATKI